VAAAMNIAKQKKFSIILHSKQESLSQSHHENC